MARQNAPSGYSVLQVTLHWLIALLVILQIVFHEGMKGAWEAIEDGEAVPAANVIPANIHATVGLVILALALVRLAIRLKRGAPPVENPVAPLRWLAVVTHVLLYGFIILMPISGAAAWFFHLEPPAETHSFLRLILVPLIILHAIGALAEHFVFRNRTLVRMLKPERG